MKILAGMMILLVASINAFGGSAGSLVSGLDSAGNGLRFNDVFVAGRDQFKSIRIPSVVVTQKGAVLAFAEGRAFPSDQAHNKIILKRSTDDGETWSAVQIVAGAGDNSLNNPTSLVDQNSGRIWLMYQRIPAHLTERSGEIAVGYEGTNVYRNFLVWSDDDGVTWSEPRDVTRSTKRPVVATTVASGPGIGIQLTRGKYKDWMIIPFNEGPFGRWNNYAVFSDDFGVTWRCGENVPGALVTDSKGGVHSQVNEVQMAELTDGSVMLNSRRFAGAKVRKIAVSRDGGFTWSPIKDAPELRDPSCMASIFRYSFAHGNEMNCLLFSGPDSDRRENGTIYASFDDGKTWPVKRVLWPGSFAYSVLTRLPDGEVGCLFEADNCRRIVFARFPLSWLVTQKDPAASADN